MCCRACRPITDIDLRNRAVIAFTLLTGARDGAIASLKLKHVDVAEGKVVQDAREVHTKFSKTFTTWFFPVGDDVRQIVVDWVNYLATEKLFGPVDPLFPATEVVQDQYHQFQAGGLSRRALVERHADQADLQGGVHQTPACPTPTRTPFARRWPSSASDCAGRPRSSRLGARTSGTSRC